MTNSDQILQQKQLTHIHDKIRKGQTLKAKEIDSLIDLHWLEWTCKYDLSPCGDLTYIGKLEYIQDNLEDVIKLIDEFPEVLEE